MLAGALATNPKLLLMDEPVGGLNPQEIDVMMAVVRAIAARGVTIILIEHVMRFLVALSDRVMIMHHGEKIYEGSAEGLVRDKTVVDVYLGAGTSQRLEHMLKSGAQA
jgi:branched-chain amino acid transport system ATP-binding protein